MKPNELKEFLQISELIRINQKDAEIESSRLALNELNKDIKKKDDEIKSRLQRIKENKFCNRQDKHTECNECCEFVVKLSDIEKEFLVL